MFFQIVESGGLLATVQQKGGKPVEKTGQKAAHGASITGQNTSYQETQNPVFSEEYTGLLDCTNEQVPPRGVEQITHSSENQGVALEGGAKSGALSGDSAPIDPDLVLIVNCRPDLPKEARQNMVAMVRTAAETLDASGSGAITWTNTGLLEFFGSETVVRMLTLTGTNTGDNTLATGIRNPSGNTTSLSKSGIGKTARLRLSTPNLYNVGKEVLHPKINHPFFEN